MRETATLEFESEPSSTFLKTVSAFANYSSGTILFGVADDGSIIGLKDAERECASIENKINDCIVPRPRFSIESDSAHKTVRLHVFEGLSKPYLYRGRAYKRSGTSTVEVDRVELDRLVLEGGNTTFDRLPASDQNLAFNTLAEAIRKAVGVSRIDDDTLKTLGLLKPEGYTRAGSLLADRNPYPGIDVAKFGTSVSEMIDRSTVERTPVLSQFDAAIEMFNRHLRIERTDGFERGRFDAVPQGAFREAVANALVHRTWDVDARVRVCLFLDRVEVASPGASLPGCPKASTCRGVRPPSEIPFWQRCFSGSDSSRNSEPACSASRSPMPTSRRSPGLRRCPTRSRSSCPSSAPDQA